MAFVYVDASSAILLFRVSLVAPLARACRLVAAGAVFGELTLAGYPGAGFFKKMTAQGKITWEKVSETSLTALAEFSRLGDGERDTLAAFKARTQGGQAFVLMDDGRGARYCARHGIPFINALLVPKVLWYSGLMDQDRAEKKMREIATLGRYSQQILDRAEGMSKEALACFILQEGGRGRF